MGRRALETGTSRDRHRGPRARLLGRMARSWTRRAPRATASASTARRSRCASAASRSPTMTAQPVSKAAHLLRRSSRVAGREAEIARDILAELAVAPRLPRARSGLGYLSLDRARADALRRRGAAHPPRGAARLEPARRRATSSTSPPSACTRATTACCSTRSRASAPRATRWSWSSTTRTRSAAREHVIDLGPGAGRRGGARRRPGHAEELMANPDSITGHFLAHPLRHPLQPRRPVGRSDAGDRGRAARRCTT